jgi:hypothetical protein
VIWGVPAVSMMGLRRGSERDLGATFNDIIYMSHPMVSRHGFLTANNQVPYVITSLNSTDGPVVLEVPPASEKTIFFGSVIDAWQVPVTDVGPEGADQGDGGKYLFLPRDMTSRFPRATSSSTQKRITFMLPCTRSRSRAARWKKPWLTPSS